MEVVDDITGFQDDLLQSEVPNVAVSGGLGLGKTAVAARFCVYQAMQYPGSRGGLACPTFPQLFQSDFIEIEQLLAKYGLRYKWQPMYKKMSMSNGSSLFFISFDVPETRLKGPEWDYGVIDEGDSTEFAHVSRFSDRIGRNIKKNGSGLLRIFGNPVPYSHHIHEEYKQKNQDGYELWEVPTFENRRYLAKGYIEKLLARYPEGTPGYRRWILGQSGVPSEDAVYGGFDQTRDAITDEQIHEEGGIIKHSAGLFFGKPGLPHGYILAGLTRQGTLVALQEVYTNGKHVKYTANKIKELHPGGSIFADPYNPLQAEYRKEGVRMRRARTDRTVGISRFSELVAEGRFKVRVDSRKQLQCPNLRNELESHEMGDANQPQQENCSVIIPMEYIACGLRDTVDPDLVRRLGLDQVFDFEPGGGIQNNGGISLF